MLGALPGPREAISVELPGHGRAPAMDPVRPLHDQATALATAALPEQPVTVIGHSYGATVGLRLALENPSPVAGLVLIEPVLFTALRDTAPAVRAQEGDHFGQIRALFEAGRPTDAARMFVSRWGGAPWDDIPAAARAAMAAQMEVALATDAVVGHDSPGLLAPGRLEGLEIPVLLIEGAASPSVISLVQQALEARMPHARRVIIPGAGHMAPVSHADAVAKAIAAWEP